MAVRELFRAAPSIDVELIEWRSRLSVVVSARWIVVGGATKLFSASF